MKKNGTMEKTMVLKLTLLFFRNFCKGSPYQLKWKKTPEKQTNKYDVAIISFCLSLINPFHDIQIVLEISVNVLWVEKKWFSRIIKRF